MTDYYSQRLAETTKAKEARLQRLAGLPLGKPNFGADAGVATDLKTMAGTPTDPNAKPPVPESLFKTMFDTYSKDDSFKNGMTEFATIMETMRQEMNGVDLPEEVKRKRVEGIVKKYVEGSRISDRQRMSQQGGMQRGMPQEGGMMQEQVPPTPEVGLEGGM